MSSWHGWNMTFGTSSTRCALRWQWRVRDERGSSLSVGCDTVGLTDVSWGIADKSGNRFEARQLTRELLGLIDGSALSITIEKIGDDDEGFEYVVERRDISEWHQCKRQTSAMSG